MRQLAVIAAAFLCLLALTVAASPAAGKQPLSIKVTNGTAMGPVFFILDGNFACTVDSDKTCYFSEDCNALAQKPCIGSIVKVGVHMIKVDWGLGSFSKKITVDPSKPIPACEIDERMGDAKLFLNC